jgi:hypothetical protein
VSGSSSSELVQYHQRPLKKLIAKISKIENPKIKIINSEFQKFQISENFSEFTKNSPARGPRKKAGGFHQLHKKCTLAGHHVIMGSHPDEV